MDENKKSSLAALSRNILFKYYLLQNFVVEEILWKLKENSPFDQPKKMVDETLNIK